jgi:hypothetical protein
MKIISIFDKHSEFIKYQYDSILKHVKSDYEYIVFNNASNIEQEILNKKVCDEIGVKCIRINVNYRQPPSNIAGDALNEAFKYLKNDLVFKIDSDMFFISDIDLNSFFGNYDLSYIPIYVSNNTEVEMWSGIFGINMKNIEIDLDFRPNVKPNSDTFGQSSLLTSNNRYTKKIFELCNLYNFNDNVIETSINLACNVRYVNDTLNYIEKPDYPFNKDKNYIITYKDLITKLTHYEFPKPYNIDIISVDDCDFMFHFKSSNWCPWYTNEYVKLKKNSLFNLLKNT